MTAAEHAHVQKLEGLVKRYRSRIAALKTRVRTPEQIAEIASDAVAASGDVDALFGSIGFYVAAFARGAATRAVHAALHEEDRKQLDTGKAS